MKKYLWFIALLATTAQFAYAADATHCVSLGNGSSSQSLTNLCDYKIEIVWCHTFNGRGYKKGFCGNNGQFYQHRSVLESGEVKENKYSLSYNSTIHYAACAGDARTLKKLGMKGGFNCE